MSAEAAGRFRALVVDDEPLARSTLHSLLSQDPSVQICGECARGDEAVDAVRTAHPEILFLDIAMPGLNGFEILDQVGSGALPVTIFVTAHDDHAIRAFEVNAIDYLLKPFDDRRFFQALERAKKQVRQLRVQALVQQISTAVEGEAEPAGAGKGAAYLERLVIKSASRLILVPVDEIDWVQAQDYYVEIHAGGASHLLRESLQDLESKLDPRRFVRIHRSAIVNLSRVKELHTTSHGEYAVLLLDGHRLKLSRTHRARLESLLGIR